MSEPATRRRSGRWRGCSKSCGACAIRQNGCPWDREQDFASIAPYTIEEAYEVADAIARGEPGEIEAELGDLLFQVVFHAQMGAERLVRFRECRRRDLRQAHRSAIRMCSPMRESTRRPSRIAPGKNTRRANARRAARQAASELADVPLALPALARAAKLGKRAGRVGFDWPDAGGVRAKIEEELREVDAARRSAAAPRRGNRRPAVRGGELVAAPRGGSRRGAAARQCEVRAAFSRHGSAGRGSVSWCSRRSRRLPGTALERGQKPRKTADPEAFSRDSSTPPYIGATVGHTRPNDGGFMSISTSKMVVSHGGRGHHGSRVPAHSPRAATIRSPYDQGPRSRT